MNGRTGRIPASLLAVLAVIAAAAPAFASGHGPVFGLATPTNGKGGWTLDLGPMFRSGSAGTSSMLRAMLTYGFTPNFQLSFSAPAVFQSALLAPVRGTSMMATSGDVELLAGWRFQRHEPAVGTRVESTAYFGIEQPGPQLGGGVLGTLRRAPGVYTAVATGLASRVSYFWAGIDNQYYVSRGGDQRPDELSYSLVYGYRPFVKAQEYPRLDWRFFAELTGEHDNDVRRNGQPLPGTAGDRIFLGPSALLIYKNYGFEAGVQWPVSRHLGTAFPVENYRAAIDFSYFF